jgi:hypothetical protein
MKPAQPPNSSFFRTELPADNLLTRESLLAGQVYLKPGGSASVALVSKIIALMQERLETGDIRRAHEKWSAEQFFEKLGGLRRTVYLEAEYHEALRAVVEECGFDLSRVAFDPIRLRVVQPGGHRNPLAAPVYYPHRDTWYAHPQSMIVWWMPLHDLQPEETFVFYPDYLDKPVANDSEIFDYADWIKDGPALKIGWQKQDSGITGRYPGSQETEMPSYAEGFSCRAGENLIFTGAHYHKTNPHDLALTRFSLDFRVVDLDDVKAGRGAPNADNRSRGTTLGDYIQPVQVA